MSTAPERDSVTWDVNRLLSLPRCSGLAVGPDGRRLVTRVQVPAQDGKSFTSSLWEVDATGTEPARRLTRSSAGEALFGFLPSGDLVFTSSRRDPDAEPPGDDHDPVRLWRLPAGGGEAVPMLALDEAPLALEVARGSGRVVLRAAMDPRDATLEDDAARAAERRRAGVVARLVEGYPIRWWDHWLGPRYPRLLALDGLDRGDTPVVGDLLPGAGERIPDECAVSVCDDGTVVVVPLAEGYEYVADLYAVTAAGARRIAGGDGHDWDSATVSPDGRLVACLRVDRGGPGRSVRIDPMVVRVDSGEAVPLLPSGIEVAINEMRWLPDSRGLVVAADDHGETALFRIDLRAEGVSEVTRLSATGSYANPVLAPDGHTVWALHSTVLTPPVVAALDTTTPGQAPRFLPSPCTPPEPRARLERLRTDVEDGATVEGWLVVPDSAGPERPAPLLLAIHGGPIASHAAWSWRWNPLLFAARGYAVLLPDPALSTGYGHDFIARGWNEWGGTPYTDLMAITDAVTARPDIDATRTAAAGGSYGGYMANWIAGHTDRFRCIVTHASVWSTEQMHGTTDFTPWFTGELGDPESPEGLENLRRWSPELHVASIRTPMLVIHGEQDHRVPISEALRLWTALRRHGVPSRLLHFPDENHWILKPQNIRLWYATVLAFLDEHVHGMPFERPPLL